MSFVLSIYQGKPYFMEGMGNHTICFSRNVLCWRCTFTINSCVYPQKKTFLHVSEMHNVALWPGFKQIKCAKASNNNKAHSPFPFALSHGKVPYQLWYEEYWYAKYITRRIIYYPYIEKNKSLKTNVKTSFHSHKFLTRICQTIRKTLYNTFL